MTSGYLGLAMLGLIVVAIMMGFPTAFTLMGLGMIFGYVAYFDPEQSALVNRVFDLMVQRTYGGMTNDTLLSIPLFVLMGYVIERAALVDRMFHAVQLSFRRLPASLAVATLIVCTFWGIASGIVGAVVVLMGVIAMRPMLKAGYDTRLAAGVITAGGTLGILIPPSVMIIVYAAVAGQSVVKLYAAAMFPGFFLAFLYFVYIVGWAMINPKVAPKVPDEQLRVDLPDWLLRLTATLGQNALAALVLAALRPGRRKAIAGEPIGALRIWGSLGIALGPLILTVATFAGAWWYVVEHRNASALEAAAVVAPVEAAPGASDQPAAPSVGEPPAADTVQEPPGADTVQEPPGTEREVAAEAASPARDAQTGPQEVSALPGAQAAVLPEVPQAFYTVFWSLAVLMGLVMLYYYRRFGAEQLEIQRLLSESVMPLAILTTIVLVVILFGITTATESAAVGAAGAFLLAWRSGQLTLTKVKEAVYLTAKTTAMVCWLFVGSSIFSAAFALLGGQEVIETWVMSLGLTKVQFLLLSQAIIFLLGWPLEWTEIIVIFMPIFIPLLDNFGVDPLFFGLLVALNLQTAFLSPPVAMAAFYLKGVAPPHVTLNQIFLGMMPFMVIQVIALVMLYVFPEIGLWLPQVLYR